MTRTVLRIVALLTIYSGIAYVGDFVVDLFAGGTGSQAIPVAQVDAEPGEAASPRPEIVTRLQARRSGDCDFTLDREMTIPSSGVRRLEIQAGSGGLHVEGQEGRDEISVVGRACASEEEYLSELTISGDVAGDRAVVETHYPDRSGWGSGTASIDLVVLVPTGLAVDIEDSSGEMVVMRTGDLHIDDSSGSIEVSEIDGSVDIDDSSGGVDLRDVRGDVRVEDGSGGLELRSIGGRVEVRDGSGGIEVTDVGGDVTVESDGSGSIEVHDVSGDFTVDHDGSGGIRYSGVEGRVDIPADKRRRGR